MGLDMSTLRDGKIVKSEGCSECFNSGYQGRTAIYEMLPMAEKVRALVTEQVSASILKRVAVQDLGMRTLREDALQKMVDGMTSPEEVMRVTQLDVL
jgi:type II secretory ATPase GspE/PulE/Tfp pilus assembly ATPase PilB-like protein